MTKYKGLLCFLLGAFIGFGISEGWAWLMHFRLSANADMDWIVWNISRSISDFFSLCVGGTVLSSMLRRDHGRKLALLAFPISLAAIFVLFPIILFPGGNGTSFFSLGVARDAACYASSIFEMLPAFVLATSSVIYYSKLQHKVRYVGVNSVLP
jgi:hypothetical protein